jgi:hypothetical protein
LLGFSILVRSSNEQTSTGRFRNQLRRDFGTLKGLLEDPEVRSETELEIAYAEGRGIQSVLLATEVRACSSMLMRPMKNAGTLNDWAATLDRPIESVLPAARTVATGLAMASNAQLSDYDVLRVADTMSGRRIPSVANDVQRIREARYVLRKPWSMDADQRPGDRACREAWTESRPMPAPPAAPPLR